MQLENEYSLNTLGCVKFKKIGSCVDEKENEARGEFPHSFFFLLDALYAVPVLQ